MKSSRSRQMKADASTETSEPAKGRGARKHGARGGRGTERSHRRGRQGAGNGGAEPDADDAREGQRSADDVAGAARGASADQDRDEQALRSGYGDAAGDASSSSPSGEKELNLDAVRNADTKSRQQAGSAGATERSGRSGRSKGKGPKGTSTGTRQQSSTADASKAPPPAQAKPLDKESIRLAEKVLVKLAEGAKGPKGVNDPDVLRQVKTVAGRLERAGVDLRDTNSLDAVLAQAREALAGSDKRS